MIELNLVPDVKQELIKARRVRSAVVSIAIFIGIGAVVLVVLLALYVFGVQLARNAIVDNTIDTESKKLAKVEDLGNTLTVQNQLTVLPALHDQKAISSRLFGVLTEIVPAEPNNVAFSKISLDTQTNTVTLEGQAINGYPAFETFRKTLSATNLSYESADTKGVQTTPLVLQVTEGERSYGQDESGTKVLRFTISFTVSEHLLKRSSKNVKVIGPERTNATDSYKGVPNSLFSNRAKDVEENQ
jgi:hypothetical protein